MPRTLRFKPWKKWVDRHSFEDANYPGNYVIAISPHNDLSGSNFTLIEDTVYFGMTNSKGGLKSRLGNCDYTFRKPRGSRGHPLARRMKYKYQEINRILPHLYVSIWPIKCDVSSRNSESLRKQGLVASLEYECLAQYFEKFNKLPEFNNPKSSKDLE